MAKFLLSAVSGLALLSAPVFAQQTPAPQDPAANPAPAEQMQTPTPDSQLQIEQPDAAQSQAPAAGDDTLTGDETMTTEDSDALTPSDQFGSYNRSGEFQGAIAGGFTAEELIDREVVGSDGEEVATISDLAIGSDNSVKQVMMDVGGFLGIGTKTVAVDISQLSPGPQEGTFQISMTQEDLEALPAYEESDQGWIMSQEQQQ